MDVPPSDHTCPPDARRVTSPRRNACAPPRVAGVAVRATSTQSTPYTHMPVRVARERSSNERAAGVAAANAWSTPAVSLSVQSLPRPCRKPAAGVPL